MNMRPNVPLHCLGPTLQNLVWQIHQDSKAPIPSIVTALLAVLSLTCQGRIKVRKRPGLISPVSLWFIVVLGSGERKSSVMKKLLQGILDFQNEHSKSHAQLMEIYQQHMLAWKAESKGILASIRKNATKGEDTEHLRKKLEDHLTCKPKRPKKFKLIHERYTPSALIKNLSECFSTTGIVSDEAARVFDGRGLTDMGTANKGWD